MKTKILLMVLLIILGTGVFFSFFISTQTDQSNSSEPPKILIGKEGKTAQQIAETEARKEKLKNDINSYQGQIISKKGNELEIDFEVGDSTKKTVVKIGPNTAIYLQGKPFESASELISIEELNVEDKVIVTKTKKSGWLEESFTALEVFKIQKDQ